MRIKVTLDYYFNIADPGDVSHEDMMYLLTRDVRNYLPTFYLKGAVPDLVTFQLTDQTGIIINHGINDS